MVLRVSGSGAVVAFANESGGHRYQRVPPTEKNGRVQTSTVTVAVLPEPESSELIIPDSDLEWATTRGSGPGGQHRNKVETCVQLRYRPTGLMVRCESERSQKQNKEGALAVLRAKLWGEKREREHAARAAERRQQIGGGARGDKRRTIRMKDGHVTDHVLGKRWPLARYLEGDWD